MNNKLLIVILILVIIAVNGLFIPHNFTKGQSGAVQIPNSSAVEASTNNDPSDSKEAQPEVDDRPGQQQYLPAGGRIILRDKVIALTFDDGPHAGLTEPLLEVLARNNVHATFFVVGEKVRERPDLIRNILSSGHTVANHSYDNTRLTRLNSQEIQQKLLSTSDEIQLATGTRPKFFRPPGGEYSQVIGRICKKEGMIPVFWTLNSTDSGFINRDQLAQLLKNRIQPGAVVLMHDGQQATIDALSEVISYFRGKGFQFVTLDQLIEHE